MRGSVLKIATWNLDRPWKNGRRLRASLQREQIRSIGADIWVFTETWSEFQLPGYRPASTPSSLGTYDASESAVAIWVPETWGLRTLEVTTAALCAEVLPPDAESPRRSIVRLPIGCGCTETTQAIASLLPATST